MAFLLVPVWLHPNHTALQISLRLTSANHHTWHRCKKSCDACSLTAATAKALATASCLDSDPGCPGWADSGECERNAVFMHRACPLSCKQCHKQDVSTL